MRYSLLKVVKDTPTVKYSYTRSSVIHAIVGNNKVKIFSPQDLHLLDYKTIPVDKLKNPQAIKDLAGPVVCGE